MPKLIKSFKENKLINSSNIYDNGKLLSKVLENYRKIINQMPTVDGEGTDITLQNTIEANFISLSFGGNTYQETTEGYNKFNKETVTMNTLIQKDNGELLENQDRVFASDYIEVEPNTIYSLKGSSASFVNGCAFFDENKIYINGYSSVQIRNSLTSPANAKYIRVNGKSAEIDFMMFIEGTEDKTYESFTDGQQTPIPSYKQPIQVIKGNNEIKVINKNKFNKNTVTINRRLATDGTLTSSSASNSYTSDFIKVLPNTTVIKNSLLEDAYHRICFYISNTVDSFISASDKNITTVPNNCKYLRFCGYVDEVDTAQLEENNTNTSYESHKEQTYPITLPEGFEMCGIGNYRDEFVIDLNTGKWYKNPKIIKHEFLAGHPWPYQTGNHYYWNFGITALHNKGYMKGYNYDSRYSGFGNMPNYHFGFEAGGVFHIMNTNATTRGEMINLLIDENEVLYYVAKNSQPLEPIEDTILIGQLNNILNTAKSYKDITIITQENTELPFNITAKALKNLNYIEQAN